MSASRINAESREFRRLMRTDPAAARRQLLKRFADMKAALSSSAIDAHREGDPETFWFAGAAKAHLDRQKINPVKEERAG